MIQDINEASNDKKYPIGMRLARGDRVYRYAKAGGTLNTDLGAKNALTQHVSFTTIHSNALVGATEIVIDVAGTDGVNGDGVIAANELEGGTVVVYPHSDNSFTRGIVRNTATTGAGPMTLTLDAPIPVALTAASMHAECMASLYLNVKTLTSTTTSVVGVPTVAATVGQYLWLQTWGPCWIAPQAEVSVGNNNRRVVFRHDGSIDEDDVADANVSKGQIAGFVLANAPGGGQGAPFIMLWLAP